MNTDGYKFTISKLMMLIALIIFAVVAVLGHEVISVPTGLAFMAAAFLLP